MARNSKSSGRGRKTNGASNGIAKVPQAHGGALNIGGTPGHRGAGGRPPSAIRELLAESLPDRVASLTAIADGEVVQRMRIGDKETATMISADVSDRLRAIDLLFKYSIGTVKEVSVESVRDRVKKTLDVIQGRVAPEQYASIVRELRPIWA